MKLTFGTAKAPIAKVLGLHQNDARVLDYVNRGQERLLYKGKWKDSYARYAICTSDTCLTWPREIETIEAAAICSCPVTIRNGWYEFLEAGPGVLRGDSRGPCLTLLDRGSAVAFDDVTATGNVLAIYADGEEQATGTVLLRYYDSNGNKVRTAFNGMIIEGERITIPEAGNYAYSAYEILPNGLYYVQKPRTNKNVRLFAYNSSTGNYKPLGVYEPDEEIPEYRRSIVPDLANHVSGSSGGCSTVQLSIVGKLRFTPVVDENSLLMISHLDAVRLACQAIKKEEDNLRDEAKPYWEDAVMALDEQLHHWQGDGAVQPIRLASSCVYGGGVTNII